MYAAGTSLGLHHANFILVYSAKPRSKISAPRSATPLLKTSRHLEIAGLQTHMQAIITQTTRGKLSRPETLKRMRKMMTERRLMILGWKPKILNW